MDWFMLTAMVIAGWAVLSVFAGERTVRQQQIAAATAAAAAAVPPKPKRKHKTAEPTGPRLAA